MILFIIPFISEKNCSDWQLTTQLLQGTLDSLANQTDQNFKVIISCHEIPKIVFHGNEGQIDFVQMNYSADGELCIGRPRRDRLIKCCTALRDSRELDFEYCMALDADDRLHCNLVEYINTSPSYDGWVIDKGYQVNHSKGRVFKYRKLSHICGSTLVLSRKTVGVPKDESFSEFQKCYWFSQGHDTAKEYFTERGLSLKEVPFFAAQYTLNHGLNLSDSFRKDKIVSSLKQAIKFRVLGSRIKNQYMEDFGYLIKYN